MAQTCSPEREIFGTVWHVLFTSSICSQQSECCFLKPPWAGEKPRRQPPRDPLQPTCNQSYSTTPLREIKAVVRDGWGFLFLFQCEVAACRCRRWGWYQMEIQILLVFLALREEPEGVGLRNVGTCHPHWWQFVILYEHRGPRCKEVYCLFMFLPNQTPQTSAQSMKNNVKHFALILIIIETFLLLLVKLSHFNYNFADRNCTLYIRTKLMASVCLCVFVCAVFYCSVHQQSASLCQHPWFFITKHINKYFFVP